MYTLNVHYQNENFQLESWTSTYNLCVIWYTIFPQINNHTFCWGNFKHLFPSYIVHIYYVTFTITMHINIHAMYSMEDHLSHFNNYAFCSDNFKHLFLSYVSATFYRSCWPQLISYIKTQLFCIFYVIRFLMFVLIYSII